MNKEQILNVLDAIKHNPIYEKFMPLSDNDIDDVLKHLRGCFAFIPTNHKAMLDAGYIQTDGQFIVIDIGMNVRAKGFIFDGNLTSSPP